MKILVALLTLTFSLSAASIQIVVRADNGQIKEDVTITLNPANGRGNEMLQSIRDWRDAQIDKADPPVSRFPNTQAGHDLFWPTIVIPSLKVKMGMFPWPGLKTKKNAETGANSRLELSGAFHIGQPESTP